MGDDTMKPEESTAEMLKAFQAHGPAMVQAMTGTMPDAAWNEYLAKQRVALPEAQLQADVYRQVMPQLAEIGAGIDRTNQLAASQNEVDLVGGTGTELVAGADRLQRMLDPEFYKNRESVGAGIEKLFAGMDPNSLTDTERENVARGLARTQGATPTSTATTVENAMTFGNELTNKRNNFAAMLGQAAQAMPQTRSGIDGFNVATRRSVAGNTGGGAFRGLNENAGQTGMQASSQIMGSIGNLAQTRAQKYKSGLTRAMEGVQGVTSSLGNLFSFGM